MEAQRAEKITNEQQQAKSFNIMVDTVFFERKDQRPFCTKIIDAKDVFGIFGLPSRLFPVKNIINP